MVRQVSESTTKYYWYPGERREWIRAATATAIATATFLVSLLVLGDLLISVTLGAALGIGIAGVNVGRRDTRALLGFPDLGSSGGRRDLLGFACRAGWRAVVSGFFPAAVAVLIVHLPGRGILADWSLPVLAALTGAVGHQAGMLFERACEPSAGPAVPSGPAGPGVPSGPAGPGVPSGPAGPGVPSGPVGPGVPSGPVGPGVPSGPAGPGVLARPAAQTGAGAPQGSSPAGAGGPRRRAIAASPDPAGTATDPALTR